MLTGVALQVNYNRAAECWNSGLILPWIGFYKYIPKTLKSVNNLAISSLSPAPSQLGGIKDKQSIFQFL